MNERLAFFCDRDTAPGHLRTWTDAGETGETLYQVWCRAALADPGPDAAGPAADPAGLAARVAAAGGGIIAVTRPTGTGAALRVATIPAAGYDPAAELLVLRPGQSPAWTPGNGAAIPADPGTFVLAPATRADQSTLRAFLDQLERLPDDYRSLLLNVLRRPGIEGALWRLERRLERLHGDPTPATTDDHEARPLGPRLAQAWPWVLTGLLVLNLLAVLGSAWWVKGSTGDAAPPEEVGHQPGASPPGAGGTWIAPAPPRPDWSSCGPPWFCEVPLAPGPSRSMGRSPPGAAAAHGGKR